MTYTDDPYSTAVADSMMATPWVVLSLPRAKPAAHKTPGKRGPRKQGKSIKLPGSSKEREVQMLAAHRHPPAIPTKPSQDDLTHRAKLTGRSRPEWSDK